MKINQSILIINTVSQFHREPNGTWGNLLTSCPAKFPSLPETEELGGSEWRLLWL